MDKPKSEENGLINKEPSIDGGIDKFVEEKIVKLTDKYDLIYLSTGRPLDITNHIISDLKGSINFGIKIGREKEREFLLKRLNENGFIAEIVNNELLIVSRPPTSKRVI